MKKSLPRALEGFTLIELLVSIVILGTVAIIGTNMFSSILKGSTKTRVLAEVKQNGNYALGVMERMIRNAKSVTGGGNSVTIVNPDGGTTEFSCDASGNKIASNGASLISDRLTLEPGCSFTVTQGTKDITPSTVTIDFTLDLPGTSPEEKATAANFKTTVTLRNY